jgi:hypothetical protein
MITIIVKCMSREYRFDGPVKMGRKWLLTTLIEHAAESREYGPCAVSVYVTQ